MARWNPRYEYNTGFAIGDALTRLAPLLRQGFVDYERQGTIDEESRRRDADYLLRLQQFLAQNEDRDLDRTLKQQTLAGLQEDRAAKRQQAEATAALAALGRQGRSKLTAIDPMVAETQTSPVERMPQDASDAEAPPSFMSALTGRTRRRTMPEARAAAGLTAEEAGIPDVAELLTKLYPPPEPEKPERPPPKAAPGEGVRQPDGTYKVMVPATPEKPPAPSAERDYHAIARDELGAGASEPAVARRARQLAQEDALERAKATGEAAAGRQTTLEEHRDKLRRGREADEAAAELAQVGTILGKIEALVPKVNTPGTAGRVAGLTIRKAQEFAQSNPDINELAALGQGYISVIAKIVQRQSGILSNQDLDRAEKSIPQPADNLEVAQRKVNLLKDILRTAQANIQRRRTGAPPGSEAPPGFTPRTR
jgi:hypothetical protein